jgi:hypothetical protein
LFDAADIQTAIQSWWKTRTDLAALLSDGRLHHVEAPEETELPYLTFFLVSLAEKDRTTAYYFADCTIQFSAHATTDLDAALLRNAIRAAVLNVPLAIDGNPVWYVLPGSEQLMEGEGRGPNGQDCWIATVDVETVFQRDLQIGGTGPSGPAPSISPPAPSFSLMGMI